MKIKYETKSCGRCGEAVFCPACGEVSVGVEFAAEWSTAHHPGRLGRDAFGVCPECGIPLCIEAHDEGDRVVAGEKYEACCAAEDRASRDEAERR